MYIDSHVHFRDFNEGYKETIDHGLIVARDSGLDAVFDMPNTNPPLITRNLILERLKLAKESKVPEVFYGLYMGLIADSEQVKQAVAIYREFPQVIGMKLYAGHSVGNLGVTNLEDQEKLYETLAKEGYEGVLAVHSEKELEIDKNIWNPKKPITHCYARPEKSEIASVNDQINLANKNNFKGKLHIAHISSPIAVELVNLAKLNGLDISCGICPHHFIYDWNKMTLENGLLYKMNPPLRSPESREKIFQYLKEGKIDWIETDHAPHSLKEKTKNPFLSGIPGLPWWPLFEEYLRRNDFSDKQIEDLTFNNIINRFKINITRKKRELKDHRNDYSFNPYKIMEKQLS